MANGELRQRGVDQLPEATALRETDEVFVRRGDQEPGSRSWRATIRTITMTAVAQATATVRGFVRFATDSEALAGAANVATSPLTAARAAGARMIAALSSSLSAASLQDADSLIVSDATDSRGKRLTLFNLRTWLAGVIQLVPTSLADTSGKSEGAALTLGPGGNSMSWGGSAGGRVGANENIVPANTLRSTGITIPDVSDRSLYIVFGEIRSAPSGGPAIFRYSFFMLGSEFATLNVRTAGQGISGKRYFWHIRNVGSSGGNVLGQMQRSATNEILMTTTVTTSSQSFSINVWRLR